MDPTTSPAPTTSPSDRPDGGAPLPAAVLWDMDGTLVDTEPYWITAETRLVADHGGTWTQEDALSLVGLDLLDSAERLRTIGGVDLPPTEIVERMMDRVIEQVDEHPPWRPGARELLAELRDAGIPCVLVTMSWRRLADAVVAHLPPGTITRTVVGDEVPRGKPHPDPYLAAAAAVGADPRECVALEDSPNGARAARAAGCVVVGIPHVVDVPAELVDLTVRSLEDLHLDDLRRLVAERRRPG
jgi:HAD superfamily hydrolase (TIGR01509 family)